MPVIVVDHEIVLRPPGFVDATRLFGVIDKNRDHLNEWLTWVEMTLSADDIVAKFDSWTSQELAESSFHFIIEYQGELVGVVKSDRLNERENLAELGYWLASDMMGRGIMTRSCRSLIQWLFVERSVNRIESSAARPNVRSRAIPERLGFTLEGYLRDCTLVHGKFYDTAVCSLLASEYCESSI
ncbi:MAG: GNAT family protein [Chloroflexi bacterium]|nr:GNAT family protein [Chloroflexota bacterium]